MEHVSKNKQKGAGRPSDYTDELAKEICEQVSSGTDGLVKLCKKNKHWPMRSTIYRWMLFNNKFSDMYANAKRIQADFFVEEIIEIADNSSQDDKIDYRTGETICNTEFVQRSRLRVDTRKWLAAKLVPRVYGERTHSEVDAKIESKNDNKTELVISDAHATLLAKLNLTDETADS
jgi:hypothetical protein